MSGIEFAAQSKAVVHNGGDNAPPSPTPVTRCSGVERR